MIIIDFDTSRIQWDQISCFALNQHQKPSQRQTARLKQNVNRYQDIADEVGNIEIGNKIIKEKLSRDEYFRFTKSPRKLQSTAKYNLGVRNESWADVRAPILKEAPNVFDPDYSEHQQPVPHQHRPHYRECHGCYQYDAGCHCASKLRTLSR